MLINLYGRYCCMLAVLCHCLCWIEQRCYYCSGTPLYSTGAVQGLAEFAMSFRPVVVHGVRHCLQISLPGCPLLHTNVDQDR